MSETALYEGSEDRARTYDAALRHPHVTRSANPLYAGSDDSRAGSLAQRAPHYNRRARPAATRKQLSLVTKLPSRLR